MRVPAAGATVWLDGRKVPASAASVAVDEGWLYDGLGLFETLALREGSILDLELHLQRLGAAAVRIEIPLPEGKLLRDGLLEMAQTASSGRGWLKVVVARSGRCLIFTGEMDPADEGRAVEAVLLPWKRNPDDPLAGVKSLNYGASLLGLQAARARGADEGVWLNTHGHVAEGCTSNIFIVEQRKLFTPAVRDGILPGTVRELVLRVAGKQGMTVHQGKVRLKRLERAGEAFFTSSLCGIRPLVRFEGRILGNGEAGATTRRISTQVERYRTARAVGQRRQTQ